MIVFGLPKSLGAGTKITQEGKGKVLARVGRERAFFFYQDAAPFQAFPHAGRIALVGAKSGKVKLTGVTSRRPLLNGRLPAFLKSSRAYRSNDYVVYEAPAKKGGGPPPPPPPPAPEPDPFELDVPVLNHRPVGNDQFVTAKLNSPKHIVLTGSDADVTPGGDSEGDILTFSIVKQPNHGTLSGQPPNVTYTPNPGRLGPDHFFFRVSDGELESKDAKVTIDVGPIGAPPSVATSGGCTTYVELTPAVPVDPALTVADPDDAVLDSAVVRITNNFEGGDDLVFTDQNGITGSYSDNTGTLTLVGTATVAAYETALRSVRYRNLASGTPAGSKDVEFTVNDAGSDSAPATKQLCLTEAGGPNDRPVGETSEGGLSYVENDGPLPVDGGFFVLDDDSTQLSGATVKFTVSQPPEDDDGNPIGSPVNNYVPGEDVLGFTDQSGITGSFDDVTGVLTLNGVATVAEYEAAMRSITYENTSEDPSEAARTIRVQVTDSDGLSSVPSNRGILVTAVNDAPEVTTSEGATAWTEGDPATAVDAALVAGDVDDVDLEGAQVRISSGFQAGDELVFVDQAGVSGTYDTGTGVLTLTGTAPEADYEAALRSIEFRHVGDDPDPSRTVELIVNDGELDSLPATKEIAVTPVNDKPVLAASDGSAAYAEGDPGVVVDPGIAASDVDSDTFTGATVTISAGYVGGDSLGFADQAGISGSFDSETGVLTLSGSASVADYQAALRTVTFASSSEDPTDATRTVTFQADDGGATENLSDPVGRDVAVTPVNDAPSVATSAGSTEYTIGGPGVAVDGNLGVSDPDDAQLEGAQVSISGFEAGDELVFVDQAGISGTYDTGTGVLMLSGGASVADYEVALQSVEFKTSNATPSPTRTVEFSVSDGELSSAVASKGVDLIEDVNEAPVVTTIEGATTYVLGDPAVAVEPGLTVSDSDDTQLEGGQVSIVGFEAGDELLFVNQAGIAGTYDTGTGVLTLTGAATLADYETALRSIAFKTSNEFPTATRTVQFKVSDGELESAVAEKSLLLETPAPPPPPE